MGIYKRERGASLIETMIAVGILGAIAYFVTGMIRNGTMGQRALQSSDDARTMTDNMAAILADSVACTNTFVKGVSIDPSGADQPDPTKGTPISQIKDASGVNGSVVYQVNSNYSTKALKLESIYVGGSGTDAKSGIMKWAPTAAGGTAFVHVMWAQANAAQNGGSPQKISKFFLINVTGLTSGKISGCQALAAAGSNLWTKTGSDIYNSNPGGVLVGIQASPIPSAIFDVFANSQHSLFVPATGTNAGYVGIGTSSPSLPLHVSGTSAGHMLIEGTANGSTAAIRFDSKSTSGAQDSISIGTGIVSQSGFAIYDNASGVGSIPRIFVKTGTPATQAFVGIGNTTPGYTLDVAGDVQATSFISTSDERLKTDVHPVEGLSKILALRGVRFRWIKDGAASIGLIAQEVEKVFPELVSTSITTGLKAVRYDALVGPIIEAVKELYGMVQAHEARIAALEASNAEKDRMITKLSKRLDEQERALSQIQSGLMTK